MKSVCGGISETGLVRRNNEDAILLRTCRDAALFLVADGIGGREHGEVVSAMLRDGFAEWWDAWFLPRENHASFPKVIDALREKLTEINADAVHRFGEMNAGSTLVLLFLYGGNCVRFSSGDSRIYLARGLRLSQLTRDDIYENLTVKPAGYGKESNGKLVAAIGIQERPAFTVATDAIHSGDRFFLCSDGVYRFLAHRKLQFSLCVRGKFAVPETMIYSLAKEVKKNGAKDNYSMIFVRVE